MTNLVGGMEMKLSRRVKNAVLQRWWCTEMNNEILTAFEPFVDERVVAEFLQITPRRVVEMARKNELPSHPIGHTRKTWRFHVSEIDAHFRATMASAVPGTKERKN
jgi:hypothetical protein